MRDFLKKCQTFAKNHITVLSSVFVALVGTFVFVQAWGPSRQTFTVEQPADYITFNSITNNPNIGDERDFVGIREKGTRNAWSNNVKIENGKEYYVRMYVHNNAAANLNLIAENVVGKFNIPNNTAKSITVDGLISSSNANPSQVWDNATFISDKNFNLTYISGSALLENNSIGSNGGVKLPDSIVNNTGAILGYDNLNGKIPGCFQYAGYVTILVRAQTVEETPKEDLQLQKTVRKIGGEKVWSETVNAKSGDTVEFQIHAKNIGDVAIENLVIRDILPAGLEYIKGSAKLYNTGYPKGTKISDNIVQDSGANIGKYSPGGDAYIRIRAKVTEASKLPECGENILTNLAQASNQKVVKNDTASVKVTKKCEAPKPSYKCENLTVKIIRSQSETASIPKQKPTGTQTYEFNTTYVVQNTQFKGVKYVVKNSKGDVVFQKTVTNNTKAEFTTNLYQVEKFTVTATIITANGENVNSNCTKTFEINNPIVPKVKCESLSVIKISRTKFEIAINVNYQYTTINVDYVVKNSKGEIVKIVKNSGEKFNLEINNSGIYTIIATVKGDNNTSSTCQKQFTVEKEEVPGISISKTVNGVKNISTQVNKDFNYEITVRNTGNKDLKDVKITDKAPANIRFISSSNGEIKDQTLIYTIPTLKVGESKIVTIKAHATASNILARNIACVDTPTIPGENDGCDSADVEVTKNETPPTTPPNISQPNLPSELPKTGFDGVKSIVALTSITTALAYYIASRKQI